jgi:hypothetical protein
MGKNKNKETKKVKQVSSEEEDPEITSESDDQVEDKEIDSSSLSDSNDE